MNIARLSPLSGIVFVISAVTAVVILGLLLFTPASSVAFLASQLWIVAVGIVLVRPAARSGAADAPLLAAS